MHPQDIVDRAMGRARRFKRGFEAVVGILVANCPDPCGHQFSPFRLQAAGIIRGLQRGISIALRAGIPQQMNRRSSNLAASVKLTQFLHPALQSNWFALAGTSLAADATEKMPS